MRRLRLPDRTAHKLTLLPSFDDVIARIADNLDPQAEPFADDPQGWIHDRLNEFVWSKQTEILESVRDHRKTAVRSAHGTGKSHIASRAIAHWVDTHPTDETFVVSTAPSASQVKAILWRYLKSVHRRAALPGYITEGEVPEWKIDGALVGWGRKPADLKNAEEASTAFQGIHAKYVLVILDEAGAIPEWLWTAVDTLVTSPTNRVLAIGNPDDPSSHFAKINSSPDWNVIKISAFDTPAYTQEPVPNDVLDKIVSKMWVDEARRTWGEDSPIYTSKVLAEFPDTSEDNLIHVRWIRAAMERDFSGEAVADLGKASLDIARQGRDESVLAYTRAGMFRIIRARRGIGDTMKLVAWLRNFHIGHPAVPFVLDADGLGGPVFDRARELRLPVSAFYAGRRAFNPRKFADRRSEQWWTVRELFEAGLFDIDPADDVLQSQLGSIKWWEDSAGKIHVETKKMMKERGLPSPDRADVLMMITAPADDWTDMYSESEFDRLLGKTPDTIMGDLLDRPML